MKRTAYIKIWLLLCAMFLQGCGTITNMVENDFSVYGGTVRDFSAIQQGGIFSVLAVIDLPLSFAMDTLLLPVTLSQ